MKQTTFTFALSPFLMQQLSKLAKKNRVTRSVQLRRLIEAALKNHGKGD